VLWQSERMHALQIAPISSTNSTIFVVVCHTTTRNYLPIPQGVFSPLKLFDTINTIPSGVLEFLHIP